MEGGFIPLPPRGGDVRLLSDTAPRGKNSDGWGSRYRSAASRNPTSSCWLRMHVPRVVDFYTGRMWYNTRMILKDDPKAYAIMGCAMRVHSILGYGFLESAYGDALEIEFKKAGIPYVREDSVRIYYDGQPLPTNWRADFTCFDRGYIVELKAIKSITKIEWAQVIHYMRATRIPYALLLNFGRPQLQHDTFDLAKLPSGSVIETAAAPQIKKTPSLAVESESSPRSTDNSAER